MATTNSMFKSVHGSFLEPRNLNYPMTEAYSLGAIAIGDKSAGLERYTWKCYVNNGWIVVKRTDLVQEHRITQATNVTELDLAFELNGYPAVVFVANGVPYLARYNSDSDNYPAKLLEEKFKHPRICLDLISINSGLPVGLVLGYCYNGNLCYVTQKGKFQNETVIATDPNKHLLWRMGHLPNRNIGFQWR